MGTTSGCAANDVLIATHRVKMDKRMGWNLDSTEHATFNWVRPIPVRHGESVLRRTYSKAASNLSRSSAGLLDDARIIGGTTLSMRAFKKRFVFRAGVGVLILIFLWAMAIGPEPPARVVISPSELVRAVTIQRESLINLCLIEHVDPNGRDAQGRTPLLIATSQQDWKTARRPVDAGALASV